MKPRKIPEAAVKRITLEVAEIAGWLAARSKRIAAANDFVDDGRAGVDYSRVNRGGSDGSSTERAALAPRVDDVGRMAAEFMGVLERWERDARRLRYLGVKLGVEWSEDALKAASGVARRSHEAAGSGDCSNCGRLVSGSSNDRLRGGQCSACDTYERRTCKKRPKALWGSDSTDDRCVAVRTHHGRDVRCGLPVGHDGEHGFSVEAVA